MANAADQQALMGLFPVPEKVDKVFYKLLTGNDDASRHGVLVPANAYSFFPEFPDFDPRAAENHRLTIQTLWQRQGRWMEQQSSWLHYHRYPERRISSLDADSVNVDGYARLLVIGRVASPIRYYCVVLVPGHPLWESVLAVLGIPTALARPGLATGVFSPTVAPPAATPIALLTEQLRAIAKMGYVPSMRKGDTGIGYTLETLLKLEANSFMGPDFMGVIELKASRSSRPAAQRGISNERVTLLSKTPEWGPNGDRVGLLNNHGYRDANGRWALYMSIYHGQPNPQGWTLEDRREQGLISAARDGVDQVYWLDATLHKRLAEKHTESVFVTAHTKVIDGVEHFWYDEMAYCQGASYENFRTMVLERQVSLDFAIHRTEDGGARDHGFLFRIARGQLPRLFAQSQVRRLA